MNVSLDEWDSWMVLILLLFLRGNEEEQKVGASIGRQWRITVVSTRSTLSHPLECVGEEDVGSHSTAHKTWPGIKWQCL